MSLCGDCVKGSIHTGAPKGKFENINGVDVYVALPTTQYAKQKALLFLPDVFGAQLVNSQLVADGYAENGYATYIIDYLSGDAISVEAMDSGKVDFGAWLARHPPDVTRSLVEKVIESLKEQGITDFAAHGYCFGARTTVDLATDNVIKVAITSHPSLLKNPDDLQTILAKSQAPILFNSCEIDNQFPAEFQQKADEILGDGKYKPGYKRTYFAGATHGFAIRADLSNQAAKDAKEGSFSESVKFLHAHL